MSFEKLKIATGFFDAFNSIGGGASCEVFSGRLFGMGVAVKRLKDGVKEWEKKQFAAEMALLSRASHPNICRLLAFSDDGPERCLVLELCTGGSLYSRLACRAATGEPAPAPLGWEQRVRLAVGIAQALAYLHQLKPQMIHRDLVIWMSRSGSDLRCI